MKMDNNIDNNGGDSPPSLNGTENTARQSVTDALNDILDQFTNRLTNGVPNGYSESTNTRTTQTSDTSQLVDIIQQASQIIPQSSQVLNAPGSVEGIDPSSPVGRSLQRKFSELEEISRRLKSRLNEVVCDTDILLSPDGDSVQTFTDMDLERDLNTDSQAEDLTPQEFFQLVQSRMPGTSQQSADNSDKSDDVSK